MWTLGRLAQAKVVVNLTGKPDTADGPARYRQRKAETPHLRQLFRCFRF
jgi:hypothetical protein